MQNLQKTLIEILRGDTTYFSEDKLLKNKLTEDALKLEPKLIKYVLSDYRLKKHFFLDIDGVLVFDKDKFTQFVNDKQFLPDSYTSFKNTIGLLDENGDYLKEKKDVVLAWPYKDCVLEGGQDTRDQKRDEIFYNEILAPDEIDRLFDPKVLTNFKRYDKDGGHPNPEIGRDDNLVIKGNNLLALHSLKKLYRGKVKLIYIDPPYNTGNDEFKYNDRFNHSSWLTFMKNRLSIAKDLLSNDGIIFISCDDNEQAYLKVLCDETFGKENFFSQIIVQSNKRGQTYKQIAKTHEYLLVYTRKEDVDINELEKDINDLQYQDEIEKYDIRELRNRNPKFGRFNRPNLFYPVFINTKELDKDGFNPISLEKSKEYNHEIVPLNSSGGESCWRWGKEKVLSNIDPNPQKSNLVARKKSTGEYSIYEKYRKSTFKAKTIWLETEVINEQGTLELGKLGLSDKFNFPKPKFLIEKILKLGTDKNSIVLDFFAGSGTTAQSVLELNKKDGGKRRFILIEQMYYIQDVTINRINKVIRDLLKDKRDIDQKNEYFIYCELKKLNQTYIDEILAAESTKDLLPIYARMKSEAFFRYDVDLSKFEEKEFEKLELGQQKDVLIECLDKNHLYVNLSEMDDATFEIPDEDKEMNRKFYGL